MILRIRYLVVILVVGLLGSMALGADAGPRQQTDATQLLLTNRVNLERLANAALGEGVRPPGWTGTVDETDPAFVINLRFDLEILAGVLGGLEQRPVGWFGAVPGSAWAIGRDVRHDLELLADTQLGFDIRPELWVEADPIMRCSRELQAMATWLMRTNVVYALPAPVPGVNYCAALEQQTNLFADIVLPPMQPAGELRADLNNLAQSLFEVGTFPAGWQDGKEPDSIRQDLELLKQATAGVGEAVPAEAWFGESVVGADWTIARGNRHDLEILADAKLGVGSRPDGWTSFDALVRCPYTVQNAVTLLQNDATVLFEADPLLPGYCAQIAVEAAAVVDGGAGLLTAEAEPVPVAEAPVTLPVETDGTGGGGPVVVSAGGIQGTTTTPYAYLDPQANIETGQIVRGTPFTALARSSAADSRMMYVSGEGFNLWIGWSWTTLTAAEYRGLPLVEDVRAELPRLLCYATFCNALVRNGDPLTGPELGPGFAEGTAPLPVENLQYIGTDFVQILFDAHRGDLNTAEVRLQICPGEGGYSCQPVQRLYEEGQLVQPLRMVNGMPVWQLYYGHHGTVRMESGQYYALEVWIPHD
ncbi:hypothetical protein ACFLYO_02475 [Chloroflexota bacterium]